MIHILLLLTAMLSHDPPIEGPTLSFSPVLFESEAYDCSDAVQRSTPPDLPEPFDFTDSPGWPDVTNADGDYVGCLLLRHPDPSQGGGVKFELQALNVYEPAIVVNSNLSSNTYTPRRKGNKILFEDDEAFDFVVVAPTADLEAMAKIRVVYVP